MFFLQKIGHTPSVKCKGGGGGGSHLVRRGEGKKRGTRGNSKAGGRKEEFPIKKGCFKQQKGNFVVMTACSFWGGGGGGDFCLGKGRKQT